MKLSERLEEYRERTGSYASPKDAPYGAFFIPGPCGLRLTVIASDGDISGELGEWQHVSVSTDRCIRNGPSYANSCAPAPALNQGIIECS